MSRVVHLSRGRKESSGEASGWINSPPAFSPFFFLQRVFFFFFDRKGAALEAPSFLPQTLCSHHCYGFNITPHGPQKKIRLCSRWVFDDLFKAREREKRASLLHVFGRLSSLHEWSRRPPTLQNFSPPFLPRFLPISSLGQYTGGGGGRKGGRQKFSGEHK